MMKVLAAIGALALLAGAVAAAMGLMMMSHGLSARDEPTALEAMMARSMRSMAMPSRYKEMKNPLAITPEVLSGAKMHWADHCYSCHANDGSGDTGMGKGLYPKAPDMRVEPSQALTDGELYYVIQNGIRLTGMPAWGKPDDDKAEDSWALVAFIRTLPKLTKAEIDEMKKMNPMSMHEKDEEAAEQKFLNGE